MVNFWTSLPKPFFVLAPMEDVTDTVFRQVVSMCAAPDVFVTEFTNCDGMQSVGRKAVEHRLQFTPTERPVVAQVWGIHPETYETTAREIVAMGFDGIDINMGCPQRPIVGHGACAALIKNPGLAREIIEATKRGVAGKIPVSVKTRIGFSSIETESWISHLIACGIDTLTVHGRTAAEMSRVPCHWDQIGRAVAIRDRMGVSTRIIGNGDIQNRSDGLARAAESGVDGVMIGRGIFENLWAFDGALPVIARTPLAYMRMMQRHVQLFERTWGETKHYPILKKFYKIYVRGFDGASDWRAKCMETRSVGEVYPIIDELIARVS